jgi:hypothetical protein
VLPPSTPNTVIACGSSYFWFWDGNSYFVHRCSADD